MIFSKFVKTAKLMGVIAVAANLTGCGEVIDEGNFGIEKYWSGEYNAETFTGWKGNLFDTIYEVYGREMLIPVENVRPKDKAGVMLKDLDLTVSVKINKDNAVSFILKTGDITKDKEYDAYSIGKKIVAKDAQSLIGETIRKFTSEEILDQKSEVERTFTADLQTELNKLYGKGTFEVIETRFANILVADIVEEKIQATAMINAEAEKNKAINAVLSSRLETLTKEANTIKEAAEKGGITVDQLLTYETIKAIRESGNNNVNVTIPLKNKPN